jgi:hypothetical protein
MAPKPRVIQNRPEHWRLQAVEPGEFADGTLRIQRYLDRRGPPEEQRILAFSAFDKTTRNLVGQGSLSRPQPKIGVLGFGLASEYTGRVLLRR